MRDFLSLMIQIEYVVFSRIQYEDLESKGPKEILVDEVEEIFVDPFSTTKDPFWKIILRDGQEFKIGHSNWVDNRFKQRNICQKRRLWKEKN